MSWLPLDTVPDQLDEIIGWVMNEYDQWGWLMLYRRGGNWVDLEYTIHHPALWYIPPQPTEAELTRIVTS